ncbi:unnamed protein product [Spirodela intermedia]|uniref:Uncharacterized protein n=1 Tax=Spirodela intermedia TaxID=51605 RepID=A0A7I8K2E9_SPIIN|nr:unnamed protein product [Spirodela intermedia]
MLKQERRKREREERGRWDCCFAAAPTPRPLRGKPVPRAPRLLPREGIPCGAPMLHGLVGKGFVPRRASQNVAI